MKNYLLFVLVMFLASAAACAQSDNEVSNYLPFKGTIGLPYNELAAVEGLDGIMTMSMPPSHSIYMRSWQNMDGRLIYTFDSAGNVSFITFVVPQPLADVSGLLTHLYRPLNADEVEQQLLSLTEGAAAATGLWFTGPEQPDRVVTAIEEALTLEYQFFRHQNYLITLSSYTDDDGLINTTLNYYLFW
ncbi:MAG: hypothetical protein FWE37_06390 [Spirochaetaceae bacterium]|nr:hypothetical protein [Spirochaetaceae bacterium]